MTKAHTLETLYFQITGRVLIWVKRCTLLAASFRKLLAERTFGGSYFAAATMVSMALAFDASTQLLRRASVASVSLSKSTFELHVAAKIFRNPSGQPYTKDKLDQDFRFVREAVFPGDNRCLMDMRRSGAVEANAGDVKAETLSAKMANSIAQSSKLQRTYLPKQVQTVRLVDEARKLGRQRLRKNET